MQSLSGGTRQKVNATLAFLFDPPVLILDEPTAGLDPVSSEILKEKIIREKRRGKLILITSHILSDLEEVATNIVYLQEGRILFSDSLENIREYTGQARLGKAIAQLMRQNFMNKTYSPSREELKT
jgi:Cu-processing system ATP-binding protein